MRVLAIETSTEYCAVALLDGEVTHTRSELAGQRHSEILLGMIDTLLAESGYSLEQLDGIGFGAGPGSFTGVRIAASVAQGLAFGAGLRVVPVCTLEAMAEAAHQQFGHTHLACALDARLDEVYFAAYLRQHNGWQVVVDPCLASISQVHPLPGEGWHGIGTAFAMHAGALGQQLHVPVLDDRAVPQADAIARLAVQALKPAQSDAGRFDPAAAQPIYLRDKVAMTIAERHARGYK